MIAPTAVFYHANCPDGFTAAWAAWKKYGDSPRYIPVSHGDSIPAVYAGDRVLILDFSWRRPDLERLAERVESVRVLDHHKTAEEDLAGLSWATFDMDRSGAGIAWDELHRTMRPGIVNYAEDRDLWRFTLPQSREVSQWLRSYDYKFEDWDRAAKSLASDFSGVTKEGAALLRFQNQQVRLMADRARMMEIGGHNVPVANATCFFSEVGEELCLRFPDAPFAAYYMDRGDGKRQWGARSRGFDITPVAKALGGGGHPTAAGWTEDLPKRELGIEGR